MLGLLLLAVAALQLSAQRTVLAKPDDTGVWVRWTAPNLNTPNGINVYRQDGSGGEWKKLTEKPFSYGQADMSAVAAANKDLKNAQDIADGLRKQNKLEGIGLALVLTHAVESREFSNYLGIIYQDKTAEKGKEYRYEVKEVTPAGLETSYGQSEVVKAGKLVPGPALSDIKTKEGDEKLYFSWKPDEKTLTGAHIYYRIGGGGALRMNKKIILPSKVPGKGGEKVYPEWLFAKDSLVNGTTYICVMKGVDLFGFETEASQEFKLTPRDKTPPAQPVVDDLKVAVDRVTLNWAQPNTKGVEGFHVYRQKGLDTNWVKLTKQALPPNARKYDDVVDELGIGYAYAIASFDKAGNENRTDGRSIDVKDVKPPVQVRNLKAVADTGVIKLTWFPNPEKDLKGYHVLRISKTPQGGDTIQITPRAIPTNAYNDTLPKVAKNTFLYLVKAVDTSYNEGPLSAAAQAILPDPVPPQTPTIKAIRKDAEALRVVWLPGMDIDLAGYNIYRATAEKGPDSSWHVLTQRPLSEKDTAYSDRAIEAGQNYFYRVEALDNAGNHSEKSAPFMGSVTTMRVKAVPQDIEIKHAKGKPEATITWTLPKSDDLIGCMVYRKEGKEAFVPVSGLVQDYKVVDKGLKKGSTYFYEIRAFDKVGNYAKSALATLTIETE
jgi:fibronectin type 3 domain-containing protein